jgi:hypothetical protein
MKENPNNEMDLLLRKLAKADSSRSISAMANDVSTAHLDADEMNAFVEGSLPAVARARYTSHLVDCTPCRKTVSELTSAAGLVVSEVKSDQLQTGFWQTMLTFLSPAVLRYAVPALAILAVIGVGVFTFRQQRNENFIAQNQETTKPSVITHSDNQAATQPPTATANAPALGEQRQAKTVVDSGNTTKAGEKDEPPQEAATADSVTTTPGKDAPKPAAVAGAAQPAFAPEPPPAPPAKTTAVESNEKKNEAVAKQREQTQSGVMARAARDERLAVEERQGATTASRKAATAGRGGVGTRTRSEAAATEGERADDDDQNRLVAGRRFRRQGNAWVDTAYDASRPTVTIVRGSEQYRALVADEPAIRTIAEQFSGEVIVVWKGRTYRIR